MSHFEGLRPGIVWNYFEEICKIPRISKHEGKIIEYLLAFAEENNLEAREDKVGNIIIIRPAAPGKEHIQPIVLQSHMDMVGEKNADHPHDWLNDPIIPVVDGNYVMASGTTLGADDGIGIAAQMAILTDKELVCGRIECLFTVDEESGMTGAVNLEPGFFSGKTLLNLDSEDEGILYIGCAGGIDTQATINYDPETIASGSEFMEISVTGLHGGHSGDEIHKGYGNSIKVMTRLLHHLDLKFDITLCSFDGGNLRNAIPREAFVAIAYDKKDETGISDAITIFTNLIKEDFGALEPDLKINFRKTGKHTASLSKKTFRSLINVLTVIPHGVIAWSKEIPDLVETSTNLAVVKTFNNKIEVVTTQRSSSEFSKEYASTMVESCFNLVGADVTHSDGYPGWKPNMDSEILNKMKKSYSDLFGKKPEIKAIHAGLECGLILEKYKGIDMISFGPTIRGAHTPEEKIEISTVQMFWDLLLDTIKADN